MNIGIKYTHEYKFTQDDVNKFAEITGDINPIHLDENYANKTIFKKRIMHGFLSASVFSKVFGTLFPGEGCIYLEQNIKFLKPMFCNAKYNAVFEVIGVKPKKNIAIISTLVEDSENNITIEGNAVIKF